LAFNRLFGGVEGGDGEEAFNFDFTFPPLPFSRDRATLRLERFIMVYILNFFWFLMIH
jgi:hypothetical protein